MKYHRFQFLLLSVFIVQATGFTQIIDTTIVAKAGNTIITSREYAIRFALTIFPNKDIERNLTAIKKEFLLSLIAEKLLAEEARHRNIFTDEKFQVTLKNAEEMFVRDKLYRDVIRKNITCSEKELRQRFEAQLKEIEYHFLFSESEEKIKSMKALLDQGISFDTLLATQQDQIDSSATKSQPAKIDEDLLSLIRMMKPGDVSSVLTTESGFYIVRKVPQLSFEAKNELFNEQRQNIERKLRSEKEYDAAIKFVRGLWKGKKSIINKERYVEIGKALKRNLELNAQADTSEILQPESKVFDHLRTQFGFRMNEQFCRINKDSITLKSFLDRMELKSFKIKKEDIGKFQNIYKSLVQDLIDEHLITRDGYRRGLQNSDEVKRDLAMWVDNGLAQSFETDFWEQFIASDDSVWNYYLQNPRIFGPPLEIKIIELLQLSKEELQLLYSRVRGGESFTDIAAENSIRDGARERRGELGYFPITKYPDYGRAALKMKIMQMSDIIQTHEGYSIFRLLDKRIKDDSTVTSIDEIRKKIEYKWKSGTQRLRLNKFVAELAAKNNIEMYNDALNSISVKPSQMFTVRYLGFGGKIPAAPALKPLYEAVLEGLSRRGRIQP